MRFTPVPQRIEEATVGFGTRVALQEVRDDVTRVTTYAQLAHRVGQHVAALTALFADDAPADDPAAVPRHVVVAGEGPDAIMAELGVIAAGDVAVPVPALDGKALDALRRAGIEPAAALASAPAGDVDVVCLPIAPTNRAAALRNHPALTAGTPAIAFCRGGAVLRLTHGQMAAGLDALKRLLPISAASRQAVYLPDAPAAQRAFVWHALIHGARHCHVRDAGEIADLHAHHVVVGTSYVPAIEPATATPRQRHWGVRALAGRLALDVERSWARGEQPPWPVRARHALLGATVLAPARAALGHPRVALACGEQAVTGELTDSYFAAGLPLYQAWTPANAAAPLTCNVPLHVRFGTLGVALPGVTLTAQDGAIRAEAPWLAGGARLGGRLDSDGYLVPDPVGSSISS